MIEILIGLMVSVIWIAYEFWRAPHMDERTGTILKPAKTISDIFKKKKTSGSYSDLEKKGRGRSKY